MTPEEKRIRDYCANKIIETADIINAAYKDVINYIDSAPKPDKCKWTKNIHFGIDIYVKSCDKGWIYENNYVSTLEKCPYCGREIEK